MSEIKRGKASYELPEAFSTEIGKIAVRWAYFEQLAQSLIAFHLDLSPAEARLSLREPRISERLGLLKDLMTLNHGKWDEELYQAIYKRAEDLAARRHLLCHSIWALDDGEWKIQKTGGKWPKKQAEKFGGHRRVMPAKVTIKIANLQNTTKGIDRLIQDLEALKASASWKRRPSP
jgi:hypothetical protein